jgi:hypothetical protein
MGFDFIGHIKDAEHDGRIEESKEKVHKLAIRLRALENRVEALEKALQSDGKPPIQEAK